MSTFRSPDRGASSEQLLFCKKQYFILARINNHTPTIVVYLRNQQKNKHMYYDDIDFYAINKGQSDTKIKNGGRGTKPTYIFMVIIPLLVIELKATPNGNPNDDFYWKQKSSSLNLVQIIPPVGLLYFTSKSI